MPPNTSTYGNGDHRTNPRRSLCFRYESCPPSTLIIPWPPFNMQPLRREVAAEHRRVVSDLTRCGDRMVLIC